MSTPLAHLSNGFVVSRATAADVPGIAALLADDPLGSTREGPPNDPAYASAFAAIDADPNQLLVVVLSTEQPQQPEQGEQGKRRVAGTLQLTFVPGLARRGMLRALIEAVRVDSAHRGKGLGRELFTWAIEYARTRGAGIVQLSTDKTRARAHEFYKGLGFVASHEGMKLAL